MQHYQMCKEAESKLQDEKIFQIRFKELSSLSDPLQRRNEEILPFSPQRIPYDFPKDPSIIRKDDNTEDLMIQLETLKQAHNFHRNMIKKIIENPKYSKEEKMMNVSAPRNMQLFLDEYSKGNEALKNAIKVIKETMPVYRRVRGDGNCFFRSVAFLYSEFLLSLDDEDLNKQKLAKLRQIFKKNERHYKDFSFEKYSLRNIDYIHDELEKSGKFYFLDYYFAIMMLLIEFKRDNPDMVIQYLERLVVEDEKFDFSMVSTFRLLTFLDYNLNQEEYILCEGEKKPDMISQEYGCEAEGSIIIRMFDILKIRFEVYILQKDAKSAFYVQKSQDSLEWDKDIGPITLFFRPGHYDLGYTIAYARKYYLNVL